MEEVWERAVETALDGQTDCSSVRTLTLDGAVKCVQGRLPPSSLLEKFQGLEHLSIANVGVSSLDRFPRLGNLQKLNLSDNRIAGGLEFLVDAGLESLRDLDLSNNRIQYVEDLAPLAQLKLVSLDLYECPVTRIKDYRSRVFGLIRSLRYLDKMDADENEPPESDEEEDDEEDEEDDDPGSGEIDGEDRIGKMSNGGSASGEGILDVDEDDESDADEEETEIVRLPNGSNRSNHFPNGFRVASSVDADEEEEDVEDEDDDDLGEEIDEDDGEEEDVVEVHEIEDSDEDEDGVEEDDDEEDDDEEEVEDEEDDVEPGITGRVISAEGEIDGHEQGEEDENGEIGEEEEQNGEIGEEDEPGVEEDDGEYEEDEEEDFGTEYLVQPIGQVEEDAVGSDLEPDNEEDDDGEEEEEVEDEEDQNGEVLRASSSSHSKRKREEEDDDDDDEDDDGDEDDDSVVDEKSSKRR